MGFCAKCGAQLAEGTTFCGSCGAPVGAVVAPAAPTAPPPAAAAGSGLTPNMAGALAYVTIIPAILFLVMEPYNKDRFIRFHAFQCLFMAGTCIVTFMALGIFAIIPFVGWIIGLILFPLLGLTFFGIHVFCIYKAYNNEKFMLPVIGKLADDQASK